MSVVQIAQYRSRETANVLRALAELAEAGEVVGLALCYRTSDHEERLAFTGVYKASPKSAVNATMRLSWRLTQMQEEKTGSQP